MLVSPPNCVLRQWLVSPGTAKFMLPPISRSPLAYRELRLREPAGGGVWCSKTAPPVSGGLFRKCRLRCPLCPYHIFRILIIFLEHSRTSQEGPRCSLGGFRPPDTGGAVLVLGQIEFWWISRQGVVRILISRDGSSYYQSSKSLDTIHRPIRHLNVCAKSRSYEKPPKPCCG